jgi:chromatin remodeling complex protein RSC6
MSSSEINTVDDSDITELKKEFTTPQEVIDKLKEIDEEVNNLIKQACKLKTEKEKHYKLLFKMTNKINKNLKKAQSKKKSGSKGGGLSVPYNISSDLKKFLSLEDKKYSRGEITTILTEYIKSNNLKSEENQKLLKFNKKSGMFKILQVKNEDNSLRNLNDEEIGTVKVFGGINKYIQHHFLKD